MHGVPSVRSLAAASVLSALLVAGGSLAPALRGDAATVEARQPTKQRPETELEAIARSNGWTMDQARVYIRTEAALDDVLAAIVAQAPGTLTGGGFAEDPEAPPTIWIKGPSTPTIDAIIAGADVPIILVDDQPWSFEENDERLSRAHQALVALDLGFVKSTVDITRRGMIESSVARTSGITDEEAATIVASLPGRRASTCRPAGGPSPSSMIRGSAAVIVPWVPAASRSVRAASPCGGTRGSA